MHVLSKRSTLVTTLFAFLFCSAILGVPKLFTSLATERDTIIVHNSLGEPDLIRVVNTPTNDLIFNSAYNKLYLSVPSSAGDAGNSIRSLDPNSLSLGLPVWIGSEPNKLAMSNDGQTLYAALDGAFAVRKFDVSAGTPGIQFSTGSSATSRYRVRDMAVSPDDPNRLAVARNVPFQSPPGAGVALFINGVQRPVTTPGHSDGSDFLAFSAAGNILYGTGQFSGLKSMNVDDNGVSVLTNSSVASGAQIKFQNGKIVSSAGHVVDAATRTLLGTFPSVSSSAFALDTAFDRAYYVAPEGSGSSTWQIKVYSLTTFTLIGSLNINGLSGSPTSLVRWGGNGLAFRTTSGQVFIVQTSLVPSGEPIPVPSPTPTITPTPSPTPAPSEVSHVYLSGSGLAYNPADQKLYVSVPSAAGQIGNSITTVNTIDGTIGSSVFIGSEPSKVVLSSDLQKLFVGLDGARSIREFELPTQSAGIQYPGGLDGSDGPNRILDFAAAPDDPDQIAVSLSSAVSSPGFRGTKIIDSGSPRPEMRGDSRALAYGPSASTLYGSGGFGGLDIMTVTSTGITGISKALFDAGTRITYHNGLVYGNRGQVINPTTQALVGTYGLGNTASNNPLFVIVPEHNRILFLDTNPKAIIAFELNTFRKLGTISLPVGGVPNGLVRFGTNGLAITQTNGPIILLKSEIVDPTVPVTPVKPGPTPTPSPSPTPEPRFVRRLNNLNNDLAYNSADGLLYISVPGSATDGTGNTITRINPSTGAVVSSAFVGSEPGRLALAENGRALWTTLSGSGAIRRFDTVSQTPGTQFTPDGGVFGVRDIVVQPGTTSTLVVATQNEGTSIYDDGVKRPNSARRPPPNTSLLAKIGNLEFGSTPDKLFGYNNLDTGFDLYSVTVDSLGLTTVSGTGNLISGFGGDFKFAEGKLFATSGRVVDPQTNTFLGTFSSSGSSIALDVESRKVFILLSGGIDVFNIDTFRKLGTIQFPNTSSNYSSLVRWGSNGLAFRAFGSSESFVNIIQSPLVGNGELPTGLAFNSPLINTAENIPSASVIVNRSGNLDTSVSVDYTTTDGTAMGGFDYLPVSGTLNFAPGESAKGISVPIINDNVFENGSETFTVTLSSPTGVEVQLIYPSVTTVSISDNDPQPRLFADDNIANEMPAGSKSTVMVNVRLSNPSVQPVSVNFTTLGNTAQSGTDYISTSGTLNFAPLETTKQIPVTIIGDNIVEGSESFYVDLSSVVNGVLQDSRAVVTIVDYVPQYDALFDFDGDGKTDVSVFRPNGASGAEWWYLKSSDGGNGAFAFGAATDTPVPADFTGDGKTDVAFWRPSTGDWHVLRSEDSTFFAFPFGAEGDVPTPADFDGDGIADAAVFRPSTSTWFVQRSSDSQVATTPFGTAGDKPVPADYDGDGKADVAIFRPTGGSGSGEWWYLRSSDGGNRAFAFGTLTDLAVPGDYTGDGKADIAYFRPSTGEWYILRSEDDSFYAFPFGIATDIPVPGDYDGDGKTDAAIFRTSNNTWYLLRSTAGVAAVTFGATGDQPLPNSYVR